LNLKLDDIKSLNLENLEIDHLHQDHDEINHLHQDLDEANHLFKEHEKINQEITVTEILNLSEKKSLQIMTSLNKNLKHEDEIEKVTTIIEGLNYLLMMLEKLEVGFDM